MDSVQSAKKLQAVQQKVQDAWNTECIPHARKGSQLTSPLKAFKWIGFAFLTNNVTLGLLWKYRNSLGASDPAAFTWIAVATSLATLGGFALYLPPKKDQSLPKALPVADTKVVPGDENDPDKPTHGRPYRNTRVGALKTSPDGQSRTLSELWRSTVARYNKLTAFKYRKVEKVFKQEETKMVDGKPEKFMATKTLLENKYNDVTYAEADERIDNLASGLVNLLNITENDPVVRVSTADKVDCHKVCIYAATQMDWIITAQACFRTGIPVVTAYDTLGLDSLAYALDLTATNCIVADANLVKNIATVAPGRSFHDGDKTVNTDLSNLKHIILIGDKKSADQSAIDQLKSRPASKGGAVEVTFYDDVIRTGASKKMSEAVRRVRTPQPDTISVIMFTSGSTGLPKGVVMTHKNLVAAIAGLIDAIPGAGPDDVYIGYLPLAHILELAAELSILSVGGRIGYGSTRTIVDSSTSIPRDESGKPMCRGDAPLLRPTIMAAVPAVMNRIRDGISKKVAKASFIKRALFNLAFKMKLRAVERGSDTPFWNRLVFDKIRKEGLGGRTRLMISGGGPLSGETQRYMNCVFCCPVGQGYGLTETGAASTVIWADDVEVGRVGPPVTCNDIKLLDWAEANYFAAKEGHKERGEVCVTGENISLGYYAQPEKTKEVYVTDPDGRRWFRTGDIGAWEEDGVLRIVDRKKDLVKLQGGEYISLGKLESTFVELPIVDKCMIYGDSSKDFCVMLMNIDVHGVPSNMSANGKPISEMAEDEELKKYILNEVKKLGRERGFASFEIPKRVAICEEEWTPENGMLTTSLKLKRKDVERKYKKELDAMYGNK